MSDLVICDHADRCHRKNSCDHIVEHKWKSRHDSNNCALTCSVKRSSRCVNVKDRVERIQITDGDLMI